MPRPNLALLRRSLATAAAVAVASLSVACDPIGPDAGLTAEALRLGDIAVAAASGQPVSIANFSDPSLCLTSHAAGAQATVAGCDDGDAQKLTWEENGAIATSGGLCLEATGGRNGDVVVFKPCGDAAGQMWSAGSNGRIESASGRCLDLDRRGSGSHDVVVWSCSGPRDQQGWGVLEGRVVLSASEVELTALEATTTIEATIIVDGSEVEQSVGWMSEDREVVEVSADGTLTARSPGSTYVVAHADCCPEAKVKVTVRQVVAMVAVTAAAVTLQVGEETTASATAKDANGYEVEGASVEWRSSDNSVVAVEANGTGAKVTARDAGEASVRATAGDAEGQIAVAVLGDSNGGTSTSSGVRFPNEPAGFQRWAEHDFRTLPDGNLSHQGFADAGYGDNYTVVDDASAPNGRAVRIRYPEGQRGGRSPGRFFVWSQENSDGGNHRTSVELDEVYISLHIQLEGEDWEFPGSELKMFYTGGGRQGTHTWGHASFYTGSQFGNCRNCNDGALESSFYHRHQQFRVSARPSSSEVTRMIRNTRYNDGEHPHALLHHVGPWRHLEYYRKTSDVDTPNGIIRLWVDGELVIEATDVLDQTTHDGDWTYGFHQFHWSPVFGGGFSKNCDEDGTNCAKRRDDFMRLGHLYISGVPR
jgi:hypothetical protein